MTSPLDLAISMGRQFDELTIPYALGGSLASSLVGEPRSTVDIDIAIQLQGDDLDRLIDAVQPTFYVPLDSARRAAAQHGSFNIIHEAAAFKVDLFVLDTGPLDMGQIQRRVLVEVSADPPATLWVTAPEDQVLRKLDWYRSGGGVSDRQWRDVVAILRTNAGQLDDDYLLATAGLVGLEELVDQARAAAQS